MQKTIFQQELLVVSFGPTTELHINVLSVEDLRSQNRGHGTFVRTVLEAVIQGRIYDNSDPDAYLGKANFVLYMPHAAVRFNGVSLVELGKDNARAALRAENRLAQRQMEAV